MAGACFILAKLYFNGISTILLSLDSVIGAIVDSDSNLVFWDHATSHIFFTQNSLIILVMGILFPLLLCNAYIVNWGFLPIHLFPQQPSCAIILSWKGLFLSFLSRQKHEYNYCAMYGICGAREDGKALNCPNYVLATEVVLSYHFMWMKIDWVCQLMFSEIYFKSISF